jgi:hypothetical protein
MSANFISHKPYWTAFRTAFRTTFYATIDPALRAAN